MIGIGHLLRLRSGGVRLNRLAVLVHFVGNIVSAVVKQELMEPLYILGKRFRNNAVSLCCRFSCGKPFCMVSMLSSVSTV